MLETRVYSSAPRALVFKCSLNTSKVVFACLPLDGDKFFDIFYNSIEVILNCNRQGPNLHPVQLKKKTKIKLAFRDCCS